MLCVSVTKKATNRQYAIGGFFSSQQYRYQCRFKYAIINQIIFPCGYIINN